MQKRFGSANPRTTAATPFSTAVRSAMACSLPSASSYHLASSHSPRPPCRPGRGAALALPVRGPPGRDTIVNGIGYRAMLEGSVSIGCVTEQKGLQKNNPDSHIDAYTPLFPKLYTSTTAMQCCTYVVRAASMSLSRTQQTAR